jgi:hypothetical protein
MNNRTTTYLLVLNSAIVVYFVSRLFLFPQPRILRNDIIQGILIGFAMSFIIAQIYARIKSRKVNGWITMYGLGKPGNGILFKAACAQLFPGPVNVPEEAMYWTTSGDGAGHVLSGQRYYLIHFPAGGLPPNDAFWSLTMGDAQNHYVENPLNRYSVSDRSGLVPNSDGSIDIYLQNAAPAGHESNWLPAPAGHFILWLRVYIPGAVILRQEYKVPPIVEVK